MAYIPFLHNAYFTAKVGIGTDDPYLKLHVTGDTRVQGNLMVGDASRANTPAATIHIKSSGLNSKLRIEDSDNANQYWDFLVDQGNALYFNEDTDTRVTFKEGGNVGFGTTSPGENLSIVGDSTHAQLSLQAGPTTYASYKFNMRSQAAENGFFMEMGGTKLLKSYGYNNADSVGLGILNNEDLIYMKAGGNVGIGTTSPLGRLQVNEYTVASQGNQGVHGEVSVFANDGDESLFLGLKDSAYPNRGWAINPVAYGINSSLQIKEHGSTAVRMTIQSGGNVGIGTTSPDSKLHVFEAGTAMITVDSGATSPYKAGIEFLRSSINGGSIYNDGGAVQIKFDSYFGYDAANPSRGGFQFRTAPVSNNTMVNAVRIDALGRVGIGTTSPGTKLQVGTGSGATVDTAYQIVANGPAISGIQILSGTNHSGRLVFGDSDNNDIGIIKYDHSDNSLQTIVNASEKTRVTSAGILMVGGTTGGYAGTKIHVGNFTDTQNGINILSSTTGYGYLLFGDGTGADTYRGQITYYHGDDSMLFNTNGSEKLRIVSGGGISFAGATNFGSAGQVLKSNGSASPAWVDASTVIGGPYLPLIGGTLTGPLVIDTAGGAEKMTFNNEYDTAPIADSFVGNTSKSYISFGVVAGSNDPGFIMHESSSAAAYQNMGVLHLCPSDDNSTNDYVSIHGSNDADVTKLHTSGLIETVNLQMQLKSGLNDVYVNDGLLVQDAGTFGGSLNVNGSNITLNGAYPRFNMYSTDVGEDDWSLINDNGTIGFYNNTQTSFALKLSQTSGNATFTGDVTINKATPILTFNSSNVNVDQGIVFSNAGTFDASIKHGPSSADIVFDIGRNSTWGGAANFKLDTYQTYYMTRNSHAFKILGVNALSINSSSNATFAGTVTAADLLTVNGDGHLFLGADGETPKIDMMYDDHASGPGWDTRIFTGKSDDLPNGQSFPTSTSAGGYGTQYQANSDGAFFGIIPYPLSTSTNYRPVINWGDDATDTPFSLQYNGVDKFTVSYQGKIAGTGHSWDAFRPQGQTGAEAVGSATNTLLLSGASVNLLAGNGTGAANLQIGGTTIVSSTRNASFVTAASSTATSSGDADATLTTKGYVDGLITASTAYRGTWNPDKTQNSGYGNPNLSTVTQTSGYYYICSADGIAEPNGTGCEPNSWNTGDWVVWSDDVVDCAGTGTGGWQKIDNSSVLSGSGTANTIPLWTSTEALSDSIITQQSDDEVSILSTSATTGQNGKLTIYSYDDGDTDVKNLQLTVNNGGDANITNTGPYLNLTALNYIKSNNVHIFNEDTFMYNGKYIRFLDATAPQDSWNRTLGVSATDIVQVGGIAGYNTGKGQLELFSNNAQAMFIDENQYVGIGTGTPSTRLHVKGGADDNEALLYVENTHAAGGVFHPAALFTNVNGNHSYGTLAEFRTGNTAGTDRPQILFTNGVTSNNWSVGQGVYSANDNFAIGFRSAHPNTSSGWATSNFVIATSGEVGIGKVPDANNILDIQKDNTAGSFVTHRNNTGFALNRSYGDYGNDGNIVEYQERIGVDGNNSSIGNFSNHTLGIRTNNQDRITVLAGGNVGINSTSPPSLLDVQPTAANRKVTRIANDVMSTYFYNAQVDAILAWTCGSYHQAEVVITANQTNGGTYNNLYIRGIWSNNHTSHHWDELEHVGSLTGSTFTMSVGQNGSTTASGRLELDFNYINESFSQLNVRVTDFYGSHSYTIT